MRAILTNSSPDLHFLSKGYFDKYSCLSSVDISSLNNGLSYNLNIYKDNTKGELLNSYTNITPPLYNVIPRNSYAELLIKLNTNFSFALKPTISDCGCKCAGLCLGFAYTRSGTTYVSNTFGTSILTNINHTASYGTGALIGLNKKTWNNGRYSRSYFTGTTDFRIAYVIPYYNVTISDSTSTIDISNGTLTEFTSSLKLEYSQEINFSYINDWKNDYPAYHYKILLNDSVSHQFWTGDTTYLYIDSSGSVIDGGISGYYAKGTISLPNILNTLKPTNGTLKITYQSRTPYYTVELPYSDHGSLICPTATSYGTRERYSCEAGVTMRFTANDTSSNRFQYYQYYCDSKGVYVSVKITSGSNFTIKDTPVSGYPLKPGGWISVYNDYKDQNSWYNTLNSQGYYIH